MDAMSIAAEKRPILHAVAFKALCLIAILKRGSRRTILKCIQGILITSDTDIKRKKRGEQK